MGFLLLGLLETWALFRKTNLVKEEKLALRKLEKLANTEIMFCSSDKDQKIIVVDIGDYNDIVLKNMQKNFSVKDIPSKKEEDEIRDLVRNEDKSTPPWCD